MTQGIIGPMLNTNVDPILETKRVYFRPSTATDTIRVGDLVCYNWDLSTDYKERSTQPSANGAAYAEGSQNYTGRILVVEKPATANLEFFAGVVARLGSLAGADGDEIEIYIPNGAVVPVMSDQNCTSGRTIVAVRNGAYEGSYPSSTARPIGIALETVDRSSTDGLVWTKVDPNMFAWQYHGSSLLIDDEGNTAETVNTINLNFAGTGGPKRGLYAVGEIAGAGHSNYGMWKFRTYLNAAASQTVHALCANLHLKDSAQLTDAGEWASSPLYVTVETEVTTTAPTLSGGSIAGIYFGYYVDESTAAPSKAYVFHFNNHASYNWDGLIRMSAGDLGDSASGADEASHVIGFDGDGTTKKIPVLVDGTTYYLLIGTAIQGVADA